MLNSSLSHIASSLSTATSDVGHQRWRTGRADSLAKVGRAIRATAKDQFAGDIEGRMEAFEREILRYEHASGEGVSRCPTRFALVLRCGN
eukprot:4579131-Amphidinium_carterae.2